MTFNFNLQFGFSAFDSHIARCSICVSENVAFFAAKGMYIYFYLHIAIIAPIPHSRKTVRL